MRNPNRLYSFYETLRHIHMMYFPDWRFGQLMSNFLGWLYSEKNKDPFFPEEDEMESLIEEYGRQTKGWRQ